MRVIHNVAFNDTYVFQPEKVSAKNHITRPVTSVGAHAASTLSRETPVENRFLLLARKPPAARKFTARRHIRKGPAIWRVGIEDHQPPEHAVAGPEDARPLYPDRRDSVPSVGGGAEGRRSALMDCTRGNFAWQTPLAAVPARPKRW